MTEINIGDRVRWESQAMGAWKRKEGIVKQITPKNYIVEVNKITPVDGEWVGKVKVLKNPKIYRPHKNVCELVEAD